MNTKHLTAPLTLKEGGEPGAVEAVFTTFDVVDADHDIVLATALTHGQEVPMAAWGHAWGDLPAGKGAIYVEETAGVFKGAFFLETEQGIETYKTVKAMGALQEWSWGLQVLDASWEQRDEEYVRIIKRARVYEVSPVLVGAGVGTHTRAIKGAGQGMTYTDQAEAVLAAVKDLAGRSRTLAELRARDGRALSKAHRDRLGQLLEEFKAIEAEILKAIEAPEPEVDVQRLYLEYQRTLTGIASVGAHG